MAEQPYKPKSDKENKEFVREQPLSYEDYAALDDGNRYELADGKLELMSPGPSVPHQIIGIEILQQLARTCDADYLILSAPLDVILSPYEVRQPDVVAIRRDRMSIVSRKGVEGPPDLVVEIISPSSVKRDRLVKRNVYARYGIPEYWVVDPDNFALEQYVLVGDKYDLADVCVGDDPVVSKQLPCVSFTMKAIRSRVPELRD